MNRRDRTQHHTALMLLACAFAFVYLLAWQFQGTEIVQHRNGNQKTIVTQPTLPRTLTDNSTTGQTTAPTTETTTISTSGLVAFSSLNALPQSFVRLGLTNTQGTLIDAQKIIISTNTNSIKRTGDSKTLTGGEIKKIGLTADSLTFYNHQSWTNVMVVMEVVHNKQSILIQAPYSVYRDHKSYLNSVIKQLTQ